jgi:hypothetical protein
MRSDNRILADNIAALAGMASTVPPAGYVPAYAMQLALLNAQVIDVVRSNLAVPADAAAIRWATGAPVGLGDPLATFIQTTLGYSNAQMTSLFAAARAIS